MYNHTLKYMTYSLTNNYSNTVYNQADLTNKIVQHGNVIYKKSIYFPLPNRDLYKPFGLFHNLIVHFVNYLYMYLPLIYSIKNIKLNYRKSSPEKIHIPLSIHINSFILSSQSKY